MDGQPKARWALDPKILYIEMIRQICNLPHRTVLFLALPMILSNLSVPLLGIVDTAILGHLDSAIYLGSVAVGASIVSFLFWAMGFLRMGTTALVAQEEGRKRPEEQARILAQSIVLAIALSLIIMGCGPLLIDLAVSIMNPAEDLVPYILSYSKIRLWGALPVLITYVMIGWLIGRQNTRIPLFIMVVVNLTNIVLDYLLIIVFELNAEGAAWASVAAEYTGLAFAVWLLSRTRQLPFGQLTVSRLTNLEDYRGLLSVNQHLFARTSLLLFSLAFFTAQGAQQGAVIAAANAILMQLAMVTSYALDAFAHASEAMVGKYSGAKKRQSAIDTITATGLWSLGFVLILTLIYALFQGPITHGFSSIENVVSTVHQYYFWLLLLPLCSAMAYWLDGIFIGLNKSRDMLISMAFSTLLIYLPVWWLSQPMDNHGLWLAFTVFNLSRGLTLLTILPARIRKV